MSDAVIVQYRGFEVKTLVREYTFNVREAGSEREFTLSIENEAFVSHRARYQDAPANQRAGSLFLQVPISCSGAFSSEISTQHSAADCVAV